MSNHHATCVAIGSKGILIRGASGSGKSTLALQLLESGAHLVSDDQTILDVVKGKLMASPPKALAGLVEIRGLGLIKRKFKPSVAIKLVVDLRPPAEIIRMPEASDLRVEILNLKIPRVAIAIGHPAAPTILRSALRELA